MSYILGLTAGHIAGIAVVALVLAALITVGGYIWWRLVYVYVFGSDLIVPI